MLAAKGLYHSFDLELIGCVQIGAFIRFTVFPSFKQVAGDACTYSQHDDSVIFISGHKEHDHILFLESSDYIVLDLLLDPEVEPHACPSLSNTPEYLER